MRLVESIYIAIWGLIGGCLSHRMNIIWPPDINERVELFWNNLPFHNILVDLLVLLS